MTIYYNKCSEHEIGENRCYSKIESGWILIKRQLMYVSWCKANYPEFINECQNLFYNILVNLKYILINKNLERFFF